MAGMSDTMLRPTLHRKIGSAVLLAILVLFSILCTTVPKPSQRDDELGPLLTDDELAQIDTGDNAWMMTSSAIVLFMTPGLAFFYGGMTRSHAMISTMLQSIMCMGIITVLWTIVGFSLAFGDDAGGSGIIGKPWTYGFLRDVGALPNPDLAATIPLTTYCFFQLTFAIITAALVTGSVVERANFNAMMLFLSLWHLLVYCPMAHMEWDLAGLVKKFGHHDFAGGTVVHMSAGFSALTLSMLLGHRVGGKPTAHAPAHVPYVILGTAILWMGWQGFNGGSNLSAGYGAGHALLMTNIAAAAAMVGWVLWDYMMGRKVTALGICAGVVVGLVGITPACGFVQPGGALIIGLVTAIVCNNSMRWFQLSNKFDDTLDVFAGHGVGGLTGMLLTSLFSTDRVLDDGLNGLFYGQAKLFWHTLVVAALVICFFVVGTTILYFLVNMIVPFRVSEDVEREGLDSSVHGEVANFKGIGLDDSRNGHYGVDDKPLKATGGTAVTGSPVDSVASVA